MGSESGLPSFERPPLHEVVLSVQFEALPQLNAAALGLLWGDFREDFPQVQCQPPLDPVVERVGVVAVAQVAPVFVEGYPPPRFWLLSSDGDEMLQVQHDRFIRNWRQVRDSDQYPRYERHIRPRFCEDYRRFLTFLEREGMPHCAPNQCEVTYVNMIHSGEGWETHADLAKVLRLCNTEIEGMDGLRFEDARLALRHQIVGASGAFLGRLHTTVEPRFKKSDNSPVIGLTLTARGQPAGAGFDGVVEFFDLAHGMIVNAFAAITTSEMHSVWRRTDVRNLARTMDDTYAEGHAQMTTRERDYMDTLPTRQQRLTIEDKADPAWRDEAISRFRQIIRLEPNWNSYGSRPVSPRLADVALQILESLMRETTPRPSILPTPSGHIQLEWHVKGIDIEVEVVSPILLRVAFEDQQSGQEWERDLNVDLRPLDEAVSMLSQR